MNVTKQVKLDLRKNTNKIIDIAKQWDRNSRTIEFEIIEDGEPLQIDSSKCNAKIAMMKPDNKQVLNDCTIKNNIVSVVFTEQMLSASGIAFGEIRIYDLTTDSLCISSTFNMRINQSVIDDIKVQSTYEYNTLSNLILSTSVILNECENAVNEMNKQHTDFQNNETNRTNKFNEALSKCNEATKKATDAAKSLSTSIEAANTATLKASNAADSATEAASSAARANASATNASNSANTSAEKATQASNYAKLSESWTHGDTGVRDGESTDNSKYHSEQSAKSAAASKTSETNAKISADTSKEYLGKVEAAGADAVDAIQNALDMDKPDFSMDIATGHLMYSGGRFVFNVNNNNGHLMWGLAI